MGFDEGWEYDAGYGAEFDSEFDLGYGAEDLYLSLIPDEERQRYWSESVWSDPIDEEFRLDSLLFAHRGAEAELSREIRLSELWGACQGRPFTMDEFPRAVGADLRSGRYSRLAVRGLRHVGPPRCQRKLGIGRHLAVPRPFALPPRPRRDRRGRQAPGLVTGLTGATTLTDPAGPCTMET